MTTAAGGPKRTSNFGVKKKKKRLNMPVLIGVGVVLVGLAGTSVYALFFMKTFDEQAFVESGTAAFNEGDWDTAHGDIGQALGKIKNDPALWTLYGDISSHRTYTEPRELEMVKTAYETAIQIKPDYVPALERLLGFWMDHLQIYSNANIDILNRIRDVASRLLTADPSNKDALAAVPISVIQEFTLPGVRVDQVELEKAIKQLRALLEEGTENAMVPFYVARGQLIQVERLNNQGNFPEADQLMADTLKIFPDAIKSHKDSAGMYMYGGFILRPAMKVCLDAVKSIDDIVGKQEPPKTFDDIPADQFAGKFLEAQQLYRDQKYVQAHAAYYQLLKAMDSQIQAYTKAAADVSDPSELRYLDYKVQYAQQLKNQNDVEGAEKYLRKLLDETDNDVRVRYHLSDMLSRQEGRIDEAIELLNRESKDKPTSSAFEGLIRREMERQAAVQEARLRLNRLMALPEGDKRNAELTEAVTKVNAVEQQVINSNMGDTYELLQLKGTLELARNQPAAALQYLERALSAVDGAGQMNLKQLTDRNDILFSLARTHLILGQPTRAKSLLERLVEQAPGLPYPRYFLGMIYLQERDAEKAEKQISVLLAADPNNAQYQQAKLQLLQLQSGKGETSAAGADIITAMPQETMDQIRRKMGLAAQAGMNDLALVLAEKLAAEHGDDDAAVVDAARVFQVLDKTDRAKAVVSTALAKRPDSPALKISDIRLNNADSTEIPPEAIQIIIDATNDPFDKQMLKVFFAERKNAPPQEIKALLEDALPMDKNGTATEPLFNLAIRTGDFDLAERCVKLLSQLNPDEKGKPRGKDGLSGQTYRIRMLIAQGSGPDGEAKLKQALQEANELTQKYPEFINSFLMLGHARQANRQYEEAIKAYQDVLRIQSSNPEALRNIVIALGQLGRGQEAMPFIQSGLQYHPNDAVFKELELTWQVNYGDPSKVLDARRKQVKDSPDVVENYRTLAAALLASGRNAMEAGKKEESDKLLSEAVDLYKEGSKRFPADEQMNVGLSYLQWLSGQFEDGLATLQLYVSQPSIKDQPSAPLLISEYLLRGGEAKLPQAIDVLQKHLDAHQDQVLVRIRLSELLYMSRKFDESLAILEGSDDEQVIRRKVETLIGRNRLADAREVVQQQLRKRVTVAMLNLAGLVELRSGDYEQGLKYLEEVFAEEPNNSIARYNRSLIFLRQSPPRMNEAITDLRVVVSRDPQNVEARMRLAESLIAVRNLNGAIVELEEAWRQGQHTNLPVLGRLIDFYGAAEPARWPDMERVLNEAAAEPRNAGPEIPRMEAVMWLRRKEYDKAIAYIQQAMQLDNQNVEHIRTYFEILDAAGRYRELLNIGEQIVKQRQDLWWVYQAMAAARFGLGQQDEALKLFGEAFRAAEQAGSTQGAEQVVALMARLIGPQQAMALVQPRIEDPFWRLVAVRLHQQQGDFSKAIETIEPMLKPDAGLTPAQRLMALNVSGSLYLTVDPPRSNEARAAYRSVLDIDGSNIEALNNLAYICTLPGLAGSKEDNLREALKHSENAVRLMEQSGQTNPLILDTQGWTLVLNGKVDEGINILRRALEIEKLPDAYYHLGEALLLSKQPRQALDELRAAKILVERALTEQRPVAETLRRQIDDALTRAEAAQKAAATGESQ